jgi:tetratricopeptide (TPR) repeat protein
MTYLKLIFAFAYILIHLAVIDISVAYAEEKPRTINYFRAFPLADRGYELIEDERHAEAIPLFEKAVRLVPEMLEYRVQLVNLYIHETQYSKAKSVLALALKEKPEDSQLLELQAIIKDASTTPSKPVTASKAVPAAEDVAKVPDAKKQEEAPASRVIAKEAEKVEEIAEEEEVISETSACEQIKSPDMLSPSQNLKASYCFLDKNKHSEAIPHLKLAATSKDADIAIRAYKQLGFLYSGTSQEEEASKMWKQVLKRTEDDFVKLLLARSLRSQKKFAEAQKVYSQIDKRALQDDHRAEYFNEGAFLSDNQNKTTPAIAKGAKALEISPTAENYYYQALRLQEAGQKQSAIEHLKKAHNIEPKSRLYALTLAYAYTGEKENLPAIPLFKQALGSSKYEESRENLAYALKEEGMRTEAAEQFRKVLKKVDDPEKHYDLRREIQQLEDNWQTLGSVTYRDGIARASGAPGVQTFDDSMQYGFETVYSPDSWQKNNRRIQLYGQVFTSSDVGKANINSDSTQGVVGGRITPFANTELYLYGARLFSIGDSALDDWQLRSTYAYTKGFDIKPYNEEWSYVFLSTDASYLVRREEVFATFEGRYGRSYRQKETWVATPHLVAAAAHQHNPNTGSDSVELGVGVSLKYWFNETKARAPRSNAEFIVQWREPVGGAEGKGSPFVRLVLQY